MLINTQRTSALRCPLCGRLEINHFSLFDFAGRKPLKISCSCGYNKLTVNTKNLKDFYLQIPCLICEEIHILKFNRDELWNKAIALLRCSDTGQELGYIGEHAAIMRIINKKQNDIDSIINDYGFDDYFVNPQVMMEVLNHLHKIAEDNRLFCQCGNEHIEIDVFPEKLELHCPLCQSIHIIYAETIEDLKIVKQANLIAMIEKGFTSFDSSKVHPNLK
ncbi:MAG TPA: hypothetical protein PLZ08_08545 [Bacillota bacterium]|nr:hypothetical protein [Bacillota bacterium]HPO97992.1 hypothetical protein [Bacillota bacterium]